jgi:hypothetical protein
MNRIKNNVVGNNYVSDQSRGFKDEVKHVFESYASQGVELANSMLDVISSPTAKSEFMQTVLESITNSTLFSNENCVKSPFYNNYADRVEQLLENSLNAIAVESALIGYAPIVAYNPFFLKKQWVSCVFKDVLMTEVPSSPVINLAFEKRYLRTLDGTEYEIPNVFYDNAVMATLAAEATGISIKETAIAIGTFKPYVTLLHSDYFTGVINGDPSQELTADLHIWKVRITDGSNPHEVPCNIKADITTHNLTNGYVKYTAGNGTVHDDTLVGNIDFRTGKMTIMSTTDKVTHVFLRGKLANRFNARSLDVVRRVEPLQYVMPESGPRLNTAVTVEDAADALVLQKIDVIADNVDIMGRTLADIEDFEIRQFLKNSYDVQAAAGTGPHGYETLIVSGEFNALPYDTYSRNISDWMKDSREYFERILSGLKTKLKTTDAIIVAVAHPNLIRFLQNGINWVFTEDTQISGMKLSYNFGIFTSAQDRVHVITSLYMTEEDGIKFLVIPLTPELVTYKHYKYNTIIDRNYRNPLYTLTPNIMVTHRTLTFEVLPVQGKLLITGRDLTSPTTLARE